MGLGEIITTLTTSIITLSKNKDVKKMVCGTYTDGRTRSIYDTLNDEYVSPRTKKRISKVKSQPLHRARSMVILRG